MYVGPGGTITRKNPAEMESISKYECDKDRIALAQMDNERYLRDIVGEANRSNISFYTMDPRGLVATVFAYEQADLRDRQRALDVMPAALLVFSRAERLRADVPAPAGATATACVLDRTGKSLAVPVVLGERADDRTGQRWVTADLTLAPLAPGDYVVEIVPAGEAPILTAIRVVR